jgi:hypothetical protein
MGQNAQPLEYHPSNSAAGFNVANVKTLHDMAKIYGDAFLRTAFPEKAIQGFITYLCPSITILT